MSTDQDQSLLLEMLLRMTRIRRFELAATDRFRRGQIKGTVHTYVGMEASGVGVCLALRRDDLIAGTHRSHGHNIAKGANLRRMMAELLGKETGYCRGRGGSMHIAAFETGSLGALAVVGAGLPIAVGAALGFQMRGEDRVAVAFTGDAASNTGNWHEALNLASIWSLPVVFVLENNRYGVSTRISDTARVADLSLRAAGYGIPGVRVDGFDVVATYDAAVAAVERARAGGGPTLLVTESYRLDGHYAGEPEVYRDRAEVTAFRGRDPILQLRRRIEQTGLATAADLDEIDQQVAAEITDALTFALASPDPDPATAAEFVYA
jgi:acetoin:2,6-dichlorophenolindophenol oxidoreductase subunit alpha